MLYYGLVPKHREPHILLLLTVFSDSKPDAHDASNPSVAPGFVIWLNLTTWSAI